MVAALSLLIHEAARARLMPRTLRRPTSFVVRRLARRASDRPSRARYSTLLRSRAYTAAASSVKPKLYSSIAPPIQSHPTGSPCSVRQYRAPTHVPARTIPSKLPRPLCANGCGRQHTDRSGQHRAFVTQDIAKQVFREHHIEALRAQHKLHGAVVDQHMIERHVRIAARYFRHHAAP